MIQYKIYGAYSNFGTNKLVLLTRNCLSQLTENGEIVDSDYVGEISKELEITVGQIYSIY